MSNKKEVVWQGRAFIVESWFDDFKATPKDTYGDRVQNHAGIFYFKQSEGFKTIEDVEDYMTRGGY